LPDACNLVVVVGGGVIGVTAALFAARRGLRVVLCEKGRVAGERSGRNRGWIRQQGRDQDELPIMVEALRHWQALEAETGGQLGLVASGVMYAARTPEDVAQFEGWLPHARACGGGQPDADPGRHGGGPAAGARPAAVPLCAVCRWFAGGPGRGALSAQTVRRGFGTRARRRLPSLTRLA